MVRDAGCFRQAEILAVALARRAGMLNADRALTDAQDGYASGKNGRDGAAYPLALEDVRMPNEFTIIVN